MADYDFLRSTYEILPRSPTPNYSATDAAFQALDAAHERLQAAHQRLLDGLDSVVH